MGGDASAYAADIVLRDGATLRLRALRPDDRERLIQLVSRLSPESSYFRFFRTTTKLSDEDLNRFTNLDFKRNVALVATVGGDGEEEIVGVGRYAALDPPGRKSDRAEIAFVVADAFQGRGIGTLLLEHLAPIARANGITRFEADVLGENNRMLKLFATSGFEVERSFQSGVFHVSFPTRSSERLVEASSRREMEADASSIRVFLNPRSVAIVGASRSKEKIGGAILANVLRDGFRGSVYPVHPSASSLEGLRAYPRVSDVPEAVDLAVVAVPAAKVADVVADCAASGVRGVVIVSSGFAEAGGGEAGKKEQDRLVRAARTSGLRLVGPNCMGLINTDPNVRLNVTFAPARPPAGNISMSSQSGALGIAILDHLERTGLGVASFVSIGNKADVSGNDLLAYWSEDPRTDVIVLYLESFGNPRKFARIAPQVARKKPIVAVKAGRSAAGIRAASSHSAALASFDTAVDALFEEAGVLRTNTMEELFDVAALLAMQPLPPGPRVGVVTNAGGPGILLADACEAHGLLLSELSGPTVERLRAFLPSAAGLSNPVDMIASATPEQYEATIEALGGDPGIDSLVVIYIPVLEDRTEEVSRAIARAAGKLPAQKPILTVLLSSRGAPAPLATGPRGKIPSFAYPENAAMALAAATRYSRWRTRPEGKELELDAFATSAIRAVVDRILADASSRGSNEPIWLEPTDLAAVLRAAGVDFASGEVAEARRDDLVRRAERLGFPLVAKAIAPGLLHKSDAGGVILGLRTPEQVGAAFDELEARMRRAGTRLEGVFLQREVAGGIEALVGVTTDPSFGPLLVCGLGGVLVELVHDVAFHLVPVSDVDAHEMLSRLRAGKILEGYRGAPPGDRDALVALVQRVSALATVVPELLELDLNPVKVLPPGQGAVVVDGRMRIQASKA